MTIKSEKEKFGWKTALLIAIAFVGGGIFFLYGGGVALYTYIEHNNAKNSTYCQNWNKGDKVKLKGDDNLFMTIRDTSFNSKGCYLHVFWVSKDKQLNHLSDYSDFFEKIEEPKNSK